LKAWPVRSQQGSGFATGGWCCGLVRGAVRQRRLGSRI